MFVRLLRVKFGLRACMAMGQCNCVHWGSWLRSARLKLICQIQVTVNSEWNCLHRICSATHGFHISWLRWIDVHQKCFSYCLKRSSFETTRGCNLGMISCIIGQWMQNLLDYVYYVKNFIESMPSSIASTITHVPFISELLAQSEVFVTSKTFFGCLEKVGPKAFHPIWTTIWANIQQPKRYELSL